ncbi:MAG: glutathione S-transferase family protein [Crocosphaera sp.]|nr:glutathione S-transferase family protein [Crocosphaera sp.]
MWLEQKHPTIADIAVFSYIALAKDGKIALNSYPNILRWIERVNKFPKFRRVCQSKLDDSWVVAIAMY